MTPDVEGILRVIAAAAQERRPLPEALRTCEVRGAAGVAAALERGADLPTALAGLVPPALVVLLAGGRPPLEHAALLAAGHLRSRQEQRHRLRLLVVPPVLSLAAAAAALAAVAGPLGLGADWSWLPAAGAGLALALLPLAGLADRGWSARLGPFTAWARHGRWAWRWERAALVARWRPDEASLALFGSDLVALAPVLARGDAEDHCRRLAAWHRQRAEHGRRWLGWALSAGLYLMAGAVLLAAAAGPAQRLYADACDQSQLDAGWMDPPTR
jgi:hypothetical protein